MKKIFLAISIVGFVSLGGSLYADAAACKAQLKESAKQINAAQAALRQVDKFCASKKPDANKCSEAKSKLSMASYQIYPQEGDPCEVAAPSTPSTPPGK